MPDDSLLGRERGNSVGADIADVARLLSGAQVLVTGGTGFLGARLVERLLIECGAKPRVLVRNYARAAILARLGLDRVTLVKGELGDSESLDRAVGGCSVVFHCAMDRSDRQSNIAGINALIAACLRWKARLVHVSSLAVYEPLKDGDLDEEATPVRSGMRYSDMKLDVEEAVMEAVRTRALDASVIIPTIVYGPYGGPWTLVPAGQLATGTVVLPRSGEGLCNAVYVDDVCQAMIRAATILTARGRRYLISGPAPPTWSAFFQAIAEAIGRPGPSLATDEIVSQPTNPLRVIRSLLRDPSRIANSRPVRALVDWAKPRISPSAKARLKHLLSLYRRRLPAPVYKPNAQLTALYRARCRVSIERAARELGYRPVYDLVRGMNVTGMWLRWALDPEEK